MPGGKARKDTDDPVLALGGPAVTSPR
jgi:hypothetical protein